MGLVTHVFIRNTRNFFWEYLKCVLFASISKFVTNPKDIGVSTYVAYIANAHFEWLRNYFLAKMFNHGKLQL